MKLLSGLCFDSFLSYSLSHSLLPSLFSLSILCRFRQLLKPFKSTLTLISPTFLSKSFTFVFLTLQPSNSSHPALNSERGSHYMVVVNLLEIRAKGLLTAMFFLKEHFLNEITVNFQINTRTTFTKKK